MPDDIAALIGLRAEMQKLIAQLDDRRTPGSLRRRTSKAIGELALKICDRALLTLRERQTATSASDIAFCASMQRTSRTGLSITAGGTYPTS